MDENGKCRCPICELEQKLLSWPPDQTNRQEFQRVIGRFPAPVPFRSTIDLLSWLHQESLSEESMRTADQLIRGLLQASSVEDQPIRQPLLILIFIPTVHKTYRDVCSRFPAIASEEVAQQALATFLELCHGKRLSPRIHYVSASLARRLRNDMFRWAVDEARNSMPLEALEEATLAEAAMPSEGGPEQAIELNQLLDHCQKEGGLSSRDRALLALKVEGLAAREIAKLSGRPSSVAVHRRVERIVSRLRRAASARSNPHLRKSAKGERALAAQASA